MTELSPGSVTVADLYRELVGMRADVVKALTRIEVIDAANSNADRIHNDHETRIRYLEAVRWKLAGASLVLGAIAGGGAGWIALALARH